MKISKEKFGELNGSDVNSFTLVNDNGLKVKCINYGCAITEVQTPDRNGKIENIVLGFDNLEDYLTHGQYFGALIGRVAGRINKGEFTLNDQKHKLTQNEGENQLHGGNTGFDKVIWDATVIERQDEIGLEFSYTSKHSDEGYPGNVEMKVTYIVNNLNELIVSYNGISDQDTLLNVTNHSYFNLSGNLKQTITDHVVTLKSDKFLELANDLIPTGELIDVADTAFDFRTGRKIADGIESTHEQNILAKNGYDHPFVLTDNFNNEIRLQDEASGRMLQIETDEPCVVLYSSNNLSEDITIGKRQTEKYLGVCLETQGFPDAINHSNFPSIVLKKGEEFKRTTKYSFSAE